MFGNLIGNEMLPSVQKFMEKFIVISARSKDNSLELSTL